MVPNPQQTPDSAPAEERPKPRPRWEVVECNCPEWCERDHELD
jgi:hypothetical protein